MKSEYFMFVGNSETTTDADNKVSVDRDWVHLHTSLGSLDLREETLTLETEQ